MLTGEKSHQIFALFFYIIWQIFCVYSYKFYRKSRDNKWIFYLHVFMSILPLSLVKITPAIWTNQQSLFGFWVYPIFTFRSVGMIMENARRCSHVIYILGIYPFYAVYAYFFKWTH